MQLTDTHTHLYLPEFDSDRDEIVRNAVNSGVTTLLMPNIDLTSVEPMMSAVKRYQGICYPMIGLHPTSVKDDYLTQLGELEKYFEKYPFTGVGEIGIDLYWDTTRTAEQKDAFSIQLELSLERKLPVAIHSRNAFAEIFDVLGGFEGRGIRGVFHAFTGDFETACKALDLGFRLGIGGIVTFKNSGLDEVVKKVGLKHLVLETDSPYLAPTPHRGKRNESSYICIINRKLADIFNTDPVEVADITTANAAELFKV
ncbi:MAG TPA: TatD family hydrolase [Bacteroidales bacterium]|nr:TatD family hydrolase [Bacteroidales bacterium]